VNPEAQTVGPVYPVPPHCPYWDCVAPEAVVVVVAALVVVVVAALVVVVAALVVVVVVAATPEAPAHEPLHSFVAGVAPG